MPDDRYAEMREFNKALSSRAWDELRNSQYIEPHLIDERGLRLGRRQLMLWVNPSGFTEDYPHTLTVFQPFNDEAPLVRKSVWNCSVDQEPLQKYFHGKVTDDLPNPIPTIVVQDARIDSAEFEAILGDASDLRIPIVWPWAKDRDSLTTDVGLIGFEFFDIAEPQASLRCGWSMDLPPEWKPVTDWFGRMYKWLEGYFDEQ